MTENLSHPVGIAALYGLVLAGGRGTRIGRDKGALDFHGMPQVRWALQLLQGFCEACFVSVRPDQANDGVYAGLPSIVDEGSSGPASGVAAAMRRFPGVAWLVIAADMPLLTRTVLATLVAGRDPSGLATAFRRPAGAPEPLCAIWEPGAGGWLAPSGSDHGVSLRRLLETGPARLLDIEDADLLASVNTRADDAWVRRRLVGAARLM
ncbi:MAG TPA: NTP transferase domain-containing protein [Gammaproteobacteria bacterium]|nr:NTP transferase domain-containing protein [Gammaproteobacteria bacterium]